MDINFISNSILHYDETKKMANTCVLCGQFINKVDFVIYKNKKVHAKCIIILFDNNTDSKINLLFSKL